RHDPPGIEGVGQHQEAGRWRMHLHDDSLGIVGGDGCAATGWETRTPPFRRTMVEQHDPARIVNAARERAERILVSHHLRPRYPARTWQGLLVRVDAHSVQLGEQMKAAGEHLRDLVEVTIDEQITCRRPVEEWSLQRRRQLLV